MRQQKSRAKRGNPKASWLRLRCPLPAKWATHSNALARMTAPMCPRRNKSRRAQPDQAVWQIFDLWATPFYLHCPRLKERGTWGEYPRKAFTPVNLGFKFARFQFPNRLVRNAKTHNSKLNHEPSRRSQNLQTLHRRKISAQRERSLPAGEIRSR